MKLVYERMIYLRMSPTATPGESAKEIMNLFLGYLTTSGCSLLWGPLTHKSSIPTLSQSMLN